jgi:hypothetical protein
MFITLCVLALSDCEDHEIVVVIDDILRFLSSMKVEVAYSFFGLQSQFDFPRALTFNDFKADIIPYMLGEVIPTLPMLIIAVVAVVYFLIMVFVGCVCCRPRESTRPSCCLVSFWVFFTIIFLGSGVPWYPLIVHVDSFVDNFPKIPVIFSDAVSNVRIAWNEYYKNISSAYNKTFRAIAAPAVLSQNYGCARVVSLRNGLEGAIQQAEQNGAQFSGLDVDGFHEAVEKIDETCQNFRESVSDDLKGNMSFVYPILSDILQSPGLFPVRLETLLDIVENDVGTVAPSFATDTWYYKNFAYASYGLIGLLVLIYIFQTVAFSTRTCCSRCCVLANNPIGLLIALIIGGVGIAATACGVAIAEVCHHSEDFASIYLSSNVAFSILGLEDLQPAAFAENGGLYNALGLGHLFRFACRNCTYLKTSQWFPAIDESANFQEPMATVLAHLKGVVNGIIRNRKLISPADEFSSTFLELAETHAFSLMDVIGKEIPQQIVVGRSLDEQQTRDDFDNDTDALLAILAESGLSTSMLGCPLRQMKESFCTDAGSIIGSFGVTAHLYVVALIGFGVLLCIRRRGMLPPAFDPPSVPSPSRSRETMRFIDGPSTAGSPPPEDSSSTSFDMYQQQRAGVV